MRKALPTVLVWIALIAVFVLVLRLASSDSDPAPEPYSVFLSDLDVGAVESVLITGDKMTVSLEDGSQYDTPYRVDPAVMRQMQDLGIGVNVGQAAQSSFLDDTIIWVLAAVIIVTVVLTVIIRRVRGAPANILSLRKSRARLLADASKVRFTDVGGAQEAKEDLQDVIDYLKDPSSWKKAGIRLPHGVLLEGPPGCGKTLLARAVAGEAKVPFFFVSASEFVEMFVGVGAARVRDMFENASKKAPCIIFIDELDAVGRRRGSGVGSAHDEREQTLNQLLVCMDGFETDDRVVVIAATNRPDVLDKALLRPGRLDRILRIPLPDRATRVEILHVHTRNKTLVAEVSLETLADRMDASTGADLEALANEAALLAMRRKRSNGGESTVTMEDFERALAKRKRHERLFDQLDQILVESASQLAQAAGRILLRATLRDGTVVEGELVWADGAFMKVCPMGQDGCVIVPKAQVSKLEALSGTESVREVAADPWAHGQSEMA